MLIFEKFSLSALKKVSPYLKNSTLPSSGVSLGSWFMWNKGYNVEFCIWHNTLIFREDIGEQPAFSWPIGADVSGMIDMLIEYVSENHLPLRFCEIDDNTLEIMKKDDRLKPMMSEYDIRWSDYIYSFEEALTFKGNKYKGQRNHINKFKRLYGEPNIHFVKPQDKEGILRLLEQFSLEHKDADALEKIELDRTKELLDVYEELGLYAACIEIEGEIRAFTIGEIVNNMLIIHIEKALKEYDGIYPTMYNGFVNLICEHIGHPLETINREDDSGDEGLRISKMQYHPIGRVNKNLAHVKTPAAKIKKMPVIKADGVVLTEFNESDKRAYFELNTDVENNQYWGYDYQDDEDLLGDIDEDTFYNFTMQDMRAGDSINFAIRETVGGEMIGEAILWNFNYDGSAEVGCRLLPDYQGKGYGRKAFAALSDFAQYTLNANVNARCFKENRKSYEMIMSSDFVKTGEDEKYFYFIRK